MGSPTLPRMRRLDKSLCLGCTTSLPSAALIRLRMAVGARGKDVTRQFLTEAVAISLAGGAVGVVLGLVASYLISSTLRWATVVSPASVLIAFGVSAAVGVLFGWYPARRAAELDPIDALRHE